MFLSSQRKAKKISLKKAAGDLLIKLEHLEAIENSQWHNLPEPAFVKGFIRSYSQYLGLDSEHVLALYRREFDEAKYPPKTSALERKKGLMLTPNKLINLAFILAATIFIIYLVVQYFSILQAPKLEVFTPQDDLTTNVPYVIVSGKVDKQANLVIEGEFIPTDKEGSFSYQLALVEGKNVIEIVASKRLAPKAKVTKIVRLVR